MDKKTLQNILNKEFNLTEWTQVLKSVFGATNIFVQPKKILLKSTDKATEAYELGNFTTSDDRIIGLYRVVLTPKVWLERNKVGLRELLRSVYKYDVDGAIIVFDQGDKWRLSFVSEIKALDDEGNIIEFATEPKRYTYLLGKDEKVKTPVDRLSKLADKKLSLEDIREAFSVEALNNEFYQIVAEHFYSLVGGTVKSKGKKTKDYGEGILKLPVPKQGNEKIYQEFAVRLIGRTVFSWFLKVKKSNQSIPLLPENLLSSKAVKNYKGYYHNILERLFFQTLNTPIDKRIDNLPDGSELIPFLNGGLFEPDINDFYKASQITGLSDYINTLIIPDEWFLSFFTELEKYNFTIDENSTVDIEVSVDPEMLGRIFENLLAEIDPDSGETARKATGSFYTPREIVDYMSIESLSQYIHNQTNIEVERIRPIFKLIEKENDFSDNEKEKILEALDKVKVLDPACGSGAFPMGALHKIVIALQKLDPDAKWWKKRQVEKQKNPVVKKMLKEKLDEATVEYAQKIGIIQNSLYGVDIQPIAAEISKLRAFLTLIVDENIDENKPNRGIEPLPNLEFKFVTADTLIKLPKDNGGDLFSNLQETEKLKELRDKYLQSYGEEKEKIKQEFLNLQKEIFEFQLQNNGGNINSRAYKLSTWNPFSHESAEWFDPEWMFGVKDFDVVIGNPPFVDSEKMTTIDKHYRNILKQLYSFAKGNWDLFIVFIERGIELLNNEGVFSFIIPNKLIGAKYAKDARLNLSKLSLIEIRDYSRINVFKTADVYPITILLIKKEISSLSKTSFIKINSTYNIQSKNIVELYKKIEDYYWDKYFLDEKSFKLLLKIDDKKKLNNYDEYAIFSAATVAEAYKIKDILKDEEILPNSFKFINTGTIDPYISLWGIKPTQYIKNQYMYPRVLESDIKSINYKRFKQAKSPKIIIAGMSKSIEAFLDNNGLIIAGKSTTIILGDKLLLQNLITIFNSSLMSFFVTNQFMSLKMAGGYLNINSDIVKSLPIPSKIHYSTSLGKVAQYLYEIRNNFIKIQINETIPNSHIAQVFEEIIDAMVMELYFEEEFHEKDLHFIKYAERDFKPIENLQSEAEKIAVINEAYQKLRKKDNEIRNNLKLMDIKLPEIVRPIKSVR